MNYYEKILAFYFFNDVQELNIKPRTIKNKYTSIQGTRQQKQRASELFEKIYFNVVKDSANLCTQKANFELVSRFDKLFDLFD